MSASNLQPAIAVTDPRPGMYIYNQYDQQIVDERVTQFRDQTRRYLAGELGADEFLALRLMNGLYVQRHAPMLRVAVPYGLMSSTQMRMLAHIARTYDKGFGHITTRQNIQYNWPKLETVPDILADLASVQMHAIQTSGNCIRNTTTDPFAGVAADEIEDPRPYAEIIRQWSTLHPEFAYLPRKFKIAITGATTDRAATLIHDIGLRLVKNNAGEVGFKVTVGGGLGRTPIVAQTINPFLAKEDLLSYLEAILRVYNLNGRRDNKYKARIKILVTAIGIDAFREKVDEEWALNRDALKLDQAEIERVQQYFKPLPYDSKASDELPAEATNNVAFGRWLKYNTVAHKVSGYRVAMISLKSPKQPPGDITDKQMDAVADLSDQYSFGLIRSTHDQNLVLTDVKKSDLFALWQQLDAQDLASPTIGTINDMIACPGLDFCDLANASAIDVAAEMQGKFEDLDYLYDVGELKLKLSGCMNGCGHHDIGNIGVLGVEKKGAEWYQISIGGYAADEARLGKRLGRAIAKAELANTIETIVRTYLDNRVAGERFIDTFDRIGITPFQEQVYGTR